MKKGPRGRKIISLRNERKISKNNNPLKLLYQGSAQVLTGEGEKEEVPGPS